MIQNTFNRVRQQRAAQVAAAKKSQVANAVIEEDEDGEGQGGDGGVPDYDEEGTIRHYDRNVNANPPVVVRSNTVSQEKLSKQVNDTYQPKVRIQFYAHESFKEKIDKVWTRNFQTALLIRGFLFLLKIASCVVYVANFVKNTTPITDCKDCGDVEPRNHEYNEADYPLYWSLIWIRRSYYYYFTEVAISALSLLDASVIIMLEFRGNIAEQMFSWRNMLELTTSIPILATLCHPHLMYLYVPSFLNCWLALMFLEKIMYMENAGVSSLQRLIVKLNAFLLSLAFTCMCGVHYLERIQDRSGEDKFTFFNSFWFVVVTFSTVGYGDMTPVGWPSKLFVMLTIALAIVFVPFQLEALGFAWNEKQKMGGNYSRRRAIKEKHVVLCTSMITQDLLDDFMNEFLAYPHLQNYYVLLLCPLEFDGKINGMLENPKWSQQVIYIQGSALVVPDLIRAKVHYAESCFVLASRNVRDRRKEDEATVLRTWAIKDFASHVPLYVQILQPEHKHLVMSANYVICEDELKYAVMASNCICPAMSTYISLLVHTLQGRNPDETDEAWEGLYARSTAQEIYDKVVEKSKFFKEFIGYNFNETAFLAHRKYGVMTIGVKPEGSHLMLNPGPNHVMAPSDTVYFFYTTSEDMTEISVEEDRMTSNPRIDRSLSLRGKIKQEIVMDTLKKRRESIQPGSVEASYIEGYPTAPYPCFYAPVCHLLSENRKTCCLNLFKECEHDQKTTAAEYNFKNPLTIICVENPSVAICNFIVPLRHHCRDSWALTPIIIMTENNPDVNFLAAISIYPLVYFCMGKADNLNDLIRAGICQAKTLVVVDKESSKFAEESYMADSGSVVAVYGLSKLFPDLQIITELTYPGNMRFLGVKADDVTQRKLSFKEKKALEGLPQDQDLFRPAFVSGSAISTSMLDTLLYQSYVKPYIISVIYLMIGLKQHPRSGTLIFRQKGDSKARTFSEYYQEMIEQYYEIPIGIYRTMPCEQTGRREVHPAPTKLEDDHSLTSSFKQENIDNIKVGEVQLQTMLRDRILRLAPESKPQPEHPHAPPLGALRNKLLPSMAESTESIDKDKPAEDKSLNRKFVIVNPEPDTKLKEDDLIYLIRPEIIGDDLESSNPLNIAKTNKTWKKAVQKMTASNGATKHAPTPAPAPASANPLNPNLTQSQPGNMSNASAASLNSESQKAVFRPPGDRQPSGDGTVTTIVDEL